MLMVCHHLNPRVPEDLAFAECRIRPSTIAAEDVLHDLGAISMIGSDSQAMGRVGEVVAAHLADRARDEARGAGALPGDGPAARQPRARRYVAKYTICPAIAHGLDGEIGSVEVGKLADLVLWDPRSSACGRTRCSRAGSIAWARDGRRQRVDPDPAAGAAAADVRGATAGSPAEDVARVRRAGRARRRPRRAARAAPRGWSPVARHARRAARPTCREQRRAAATSGSTPTRSPSGSTARSIEAAPAAELPMAQRYFLF